MKLGRFKASRIREIRSIIEGKRKPIEGTDFDSIDEEFDEQLLKSLIDCCRSKFPVGDVTPMDTWLAPRLHSALRLKPSVAADPLVWAWLSTAVVPDFVEHRFPLATTKNPWWRYAYHDLIRMALSRLWWGAEMLRDGPDYSLTLKGFRSVRSFMFVSELQYSWHREAARAFCRVLADKAATDAQAQDLSKLVNAGLATTALEHWDASQQGEPDIDVDWLSRTPTLAQLTKDVSELSGPKDGCSRRLVEEGIYDWILGQWDLLV